MRSTGIKYLKNVFLKALKIDKILRTYTRPKLKGKTGIYREVTEQGPLPPFADPNKSDFSFWRTWARGTGIKPKAHTRRRVYRQPIISWDPQVKGESEVNEVSDNLATQVHSSLFGPETSCSKPCLRGFQIGRIPKHLAEISTVSFYRKVP